MGDEFPKTVNSDKEFMDALGVTREPGDDLDKIVEKILSKTSNSYKTKAKPYEKNGNFFMMMIYNFFGKVYSQIPDNKDITDEIIKNSVIEFYKQQNVVSIKTPFWSEDMYQEHVNALRSLFRLPIMGGFSFASIESSFDSQEDLSTFEPQRFGNKLGKYIGISFGISLLICLMIFTPSLVMNHFIYKPLFMRLVLGFYSTFLFVFLLPYYIFLGIADPTKSPRKHALFPIRPYFVVDGQLVNNYTWEISKSLFGTDSYFNTLYDGNNTDILYQMTWLKSAPHEKDLKPIAVTLESIVGKPPLAVS